MACIRGRTDIAVAGGTIAAILMLSGTVLAVLGGRGMVAVGIRTFAAIIAGIIAAVAGTVVILPCAVRVSAMAGAVVHQLVTIPAVFIPITARPACIGRAVICTGAEIFTAVGAIFVIGTSRPGVVRGIVIAHRGVVTGVIMPAITAITIAAIRVCILRKQESSGAICTTNPSVMLACVHIVIAVIPIAV